MLGEEASLVAVSEIGANPALVELLADAVAYHGRELASSLKSEIVNNRSSEAGVVLAWSISKLHPMVSTKHMRAILGTGYDALDVGLLMDTSGCLLFDLASPTLGTQSSRFLGAIWLPKHQMAMGHRENDRPHVIIVDEEHLFQYGSLPNLLAEGRKFGIGVIVATQYMGQLRDDLAEPLESNAGTLITLTTGLPYAMRSSIRLGSWPVEELVRLRPCRRLQASLATTYVRNHSP